MIIIFNYCTYFLSGNDLNNSKDSNKPKISIFIPIYKKEKYIKKCINSIQCQSLKDLEIIAINDFSNDTSLKILEQLRKNDSRIKIVNNDKNNGLLYSRAMGILNCKGEYLMNLDPDDEFEGPDNLEYLYRIIIKSKVDLLTFGVLFKYNNKIIKKCTNYHKKYRQPKLFKSIFNSMNNLEDFLIWNKLAKRNVYIKAYEEFKDKIYGRKWNYHEDNIWSILLNKYANSKICLNKLIYIYNDMNDSLMKNRHDLMELNNILYRHEMFKKIFSKKEDNKYLISEYLEIISFIEDSNNYYLLIKKNKNLRNEFINIFMHLLKTYQISNLIKKRVLNFLSFYL